ncbi:MAG: nitrous oxide reductase accessory protein NosL [Saprospiraceae bacterium]|nr:nitrous oxide reductase accessory protein NosL [Saprospiraceae bacterium]
MKKICRIIFILFLFSACSPQPSPIEYGADMCDYCKMTIVDARHAAELVTDKGKVFKFDAIECLLPFRNESDQSFAFILVNDFAEPGELIDATSSTYLISRAIPSPMGAYLSAFSRSEVAKEIQRDKGGALYDWNGINEKFLNDGLAGYQIN